MSGESSASRLLLDEAPLVVLPQLAVALGLNEAIFVQQVHYWLRINEKASKNYRDGRYWTYSTYDEWQMQFPFWSTRTLKRIVSSLESSGVLVTACYNKRGYDNTKWYSIDYEVFDRLTSSAALMEEVPCQVVTAERATSEDEDPGDNLARPSCQLVTTTVPHCHDHGATLTRPIPETREETPKETPAERGASAPTPSKALERPSRYVALDTAPTVEEAIERAKQNATAAKVGKGTKRTVPKNANTALRLFGSLFEETFEGKAPLVAGKDRSLLRQMIEHYGYETVETWMRWLFRNWSKFVRECKVNGVPTVGMLYGFRGYLQENAGEAPPLEEAVGESPWGV